MAGIDKGRLVRLHWSAGRAKRHFVNTFRSIRAAARTESLQIVRDAPALPGWCLLVGLASSLLLLFADMAHARLTVNPREATTVLLLAALAGGLRFALRLPGSRGERIARDAAEYFSLFMLICLLGAVASYPAAAESHGFADAALERIDRALHFDWVEWYDVVSAHTALQWLGRLVYESIFVTPAILLGYFAVSGQRASARRFIATFWLAAMVTLLLFPLMPAQGPLAFLWHGHIPYMPVSALYQSQLIPELRDHAMRSIDIDALHGLVCAPSFHAVSGVLFIVTAWPIARLRAPIVALNVAMLLATPVEGTHYLADILGGALVALGSAIAMNEISRRVATIDAVEPSLDADGVAVEV